MSKNNPKWIEKSIPSTTSIAPPSKKEERSIPQTTNTPPPNKSGNGEKK